LGRKRGEDRTEEGSEEEEMGEEKRKWDRR
jgi:hypothetical protein